MGIFDGFLTLGQDINKQKGSKNSNETEQGVVSEKLPELTLEMDNEALAKLTLKWEKEWTSSDVYAKWQKHGEENDKYWLGEHYNRPELDKRRPYVDNAIFESVETVLPQITRRNPEPMVDPATALEPTPEVLAYAKQVQKKLAEIADLIKLRLKLKRATRHWALSLIGAARMGWDLDKDIPTVSITRPKKLILDPTATVDEDGYTGKRVGEYREMEAGLLITTLEGIGGEEEGIKAVKDLVKEDLGTTVRFIAWDTAEYMCWVMGKKVLLKKKTPHWNYDTQEEAPYTDQGLPQLDAEGKPLMNDVPGVNHFPAPKLPWVFLSVFGTGKQPVDETSLIGQNLANQDAINKRNRQIDKNVDSMNGGMVVSAARSGLDAAKAKTVSQALKNGGTIVIPEGAPADAIARMTAPALPTDVFNDLQDKRNRLKDIFGTRGSTPSGIESESTVRGKIINRGLDTDRIGGGISEYLEQFADDIYNWMVQLLYVYDDEFALKQDKFPIVVSVKEGSLLPKDTTTLANQAIELASAGKMSLIDLFKALDKPNPEELAANVWLELNAPQILFADDPRVQQAIAAMQAPKDKPPSESINFADLTPDAKAQMLAKVGIQADPAALAAYDEHVATQEAEGRKVEAAFNAELKPDKPKTPETK